MSDELTPAPAPGLPPDLMGGIPPAGLDEANVPIGTSPDEGADIARLESDGVRQARESQRARAEAIAGRKADQARAAHAAEVQRLARNKVLRRNEELHAENETLKAQIRIRGDVMEQEQEQAQAHASPPPGAHRSRDEVLDDLHAARARLDALALEIDGQNDQIRQADAMKAEIARNMGVSWSPNGPDNATGFGMVGPTGKLSPAFVIALANQALAAQGGARDRLDGELVRRHAALHYRIRNLWFELLAHPGSRLTSREVVELKEEVWPGPVDPARAARGTPEDPPQQARPSLV